ncbi:MAG: phosphatase PAP2 family protein [Firmicutes bacterium]|nr:phosphatase PAP2 family protein [Bacillota bacterium]
MALGMGRRRSAAAFLGFAAWVVAGAAAAIVVLYGLNAFVAPSGAPWERLWVLRAHSWAGPAGVRAMALVTELGYARPIAAIGLAVVVYWIWRGTAWKALVLAVDTLVLEALNTYTKNAFHRLRPNLFPHEAVAGYSFPSGHAFAAVAFFGCAAYLMAKGAPRRTRRLIWWAWGVLALLLGLSRLVLGVHYPTDVIGGYLAGAALLGGVVAGVRRWRAAED